MGKFELDQQDTVTVKGDAGAVGRDDAPHQWVTVVNPTNHQKLLQACDRCGVVKSENSVIRKCRAPRDRSLLLSAGSRLRDVC